MPNPFDQFDTPPAKGGAVRPLTPPAPKKPEIRQVGNQLGVVDDQGNFTPTYTSPEKPAKDPQIDANERKSAGFAKRAIGAYINYRLHGQGARSVVGQEMAGHQLTANILNSLPDAVGNSDVRRLSDQAELEFISAQLRQDSGATIPPEEIAAQRPTWFPKPGDTDPGVLENYDNARKRAIEGLVAAAGDQINADPELQRLIDEYKKMSAVPFETLNGQALGPGRRLPPEKEQELLVMVRRGASPEEIDAFLKPFNIMSPNAGREKTSDAFDYSAIDAPVQQQIDAKMAEHGGAGAAGVMGAVDSATLGLSDEITAGGNAFVGALQGKGSIGDLYNQNIGVERGYRDQLQQHHGGAYLGGQFLGGIALPMGAGATGVRGLARVGAAQGAGYGFGSGEGNPIQRLPNALLGAGGGAAIGASLGAAAPYVSNALTRILPNRGLDDAAREVVQAGERRQVPVRQYDVRPDQRGNRAEALTSERGGPIIRAADDADRDAMEAALLRDVGGDVAPGDRMDVGNTIQGALDRSRKASGQQGRTLYDRAEKLAGNAKLVPNRAIAEIDNQIAELEAAGPKGNRELISYLKDVRDDLSREGGLTIGALRNQRTNMRGQISARNLAKTDADRRMGMVLDAASEDINSGLSGPAQAAFRRADQHWAERSRFIKQVMQKLVGPEDNRLSPNATAAQLESWMKKDFGRFRRTWAEMTPDERSEIGAAVAGNLGRDSKGNFSISLFLNHTSGKGKQSMLSPQAMRQVFGEDGMRAIQDLRALASAKVAGMSETNTSKTGNIVQRVGRGLRSTLLTLLGFQMGGVGGAIAAPVLQSFVRKAGQERMARMLTNPDFTKWLRSTPESASPEVINRHFARLTSIASRNPVMAADAKALQQVLAETFTPKIAASEADQGRDDEK